ncbi:MAG: hypothetical protein QOK10_2526, partial [Pseudonocardiales bacterium]|nr:hypothetical protein [Pseudonocardiales bacterium]
VRRASASWNIYYRFAPSAWGNGYAAEVIRASAPLAEQLEPGAMLQATMQPWNTASRAVAESLGMRFCLEQLDHAGVPELIYQLPAAELG